MSDSCSPDKRCPDQRCAGSGASAGGSEELLLKRAHASKTPPSTKHKNKRRSGSSSPASTQSTRQFRPTEGGNACLAHAASRVLLPLPPPTPPLLPSPRFADCRQRPSHAANRKLDIGTSQSTDGEGGSQAITCAQAASLDEGDEGSHDAPAPAPAPATVPAPALPKPKPQPLQLPKTAGAGDAGDDDDGYNTPLPEGFTSPRLSPASASHSDDAQAATLDEGEEESHDASAGHARTRADSGSGEGGGLAAVPHDSTPQVPSLLHYKTCEDLQKAANGHIRHALVAALGQDVLAKALQAFCDDASMKLLQSKILENQATVDSLQTNMDAEMTSRDDTALQVVCRLPVAVCYIHTCILSALFLTC